MYVVQPSEFKYFLEMNYGHALHSSCPDELCCIIKVTSSGDLIRVLSVKDATELRDTTCSIWGWGWGGGGGGGNCEYFASSCIYF